MADKSSATVGVDGDAGGTGLTGVVPAQSAPAARRKVVARQPMSGRERTVIGSAMVLLPLLLLSQVIAVWPSVIAATTTNAKQPTMTWLFGVAHMVLQPDAALFVMVALVGALASLAEVSFRFVINAGRDELTTRWTWHYVLRPVQGAVLAVVVYFALRGGLLGNDRTQPLNPYGVAAFAGLVGLFTRQAFQKLKDVFNTLWGVEDPDHDLEATRTNRAHTQKSRTPLT